MSWFKQKPKPSEFYDELPLEEPSTGMLNISNATLLARLSGILKTRRRFRLFVIVMFLIFLSSCFFADKIGLTLEPFFNVIDYGSNSTVNAIVDIQKSSPRFIPMCLGLTCYLVYALVKTFGGIINSMKLKQTILELARRGEPELATRLDAFIKVRNQLNIDPSRNLYFSEIALAIPYIDRDTFSKLSSDTQEFFVTCLLHREKSVQEATKRVIQEQGTGSILKHMRNTLESVSARSRIGKFQSLQYSLPTQVSKRYFLAVNDESYSLFEAELKECISLLSQRLEKENTSTTLLRASTSPHHDNELLRTVQNLPDSCLETLIRASDDPSNEKTVSEIASNYLGETREIQGDGTQKNLSS